MKRITVTLTEDQTRDLIALVTNGIVNNCAFLKEVQEGGKKMYEGYDTTSLEAKIGFRNRLLSDLTDKLDS